MYLLFSMPRTEIEWKPIEIIGRYLDYAVGYIPDTHVDIIRYRHLEAVELDEAVAKAWLFNKAYNNQVSIRADTDQSEQLEILSSIEDSTVKVKYDLTAEEQLNGTKFLRAVMRKKVDDTYEQRYNALQPTKLEETTWTSQREELNKYRNDNTAVVPTITKLAEGKGITVSEMADLIETAIASYDDAVTNLLKNKQIIKGEIDGCSSIADCLALMHNNFGIDAPYPMRDEYSIAGPAQFNI